MYEACAIVPYCPRHRAEKCACAKVLGGDARPANTVLRDRARRQDARALSGDQRLCAIGHTRGIGGGGAGNGVLEAAGEFDVLHITRFEREALFGLQEADHNRQVGVLAQAVDFEA